MLPSPLEVRQIMNDTYNVFYRKWINPGITIDAAAMMQEAHELDRKYDCELCRHMIADLIVCIEDEYRRRESK